MSTSAPGSRFRLLGRLAALLGLCASAPGFFAAAAHAQRAGDHVPEPAPEGVGLRLVLEAAQGPVFLKPGGGARYGFAGTFAPGLSYGALELGGALAGVYRNPDWDLGVGARASLGVVSALSGLFRLRLATEALYLTRASGVRGALGLIPDVSGFLRLSIWFGRDFDNHSNFLMVGVASDFTTWHDPVGALLEAGPMQEAPDGQH